MLKEVIDKNGQLKFYGMSLETAMKKNMQEELVNIEYQNARLCSIENTILDTMVLYKSFLDTRMVKR